MDTVFVALRVVLSLAVVLGLLWALHRRISRSSRVRTTGKPIEIVGRQAVGQKSAVVIIEVDGHRMLLGVTEQQVTVLRQNEIRQPTVDDIEFSRIMAEAAELGRPELELHPVASSRPNPAVPDAALPTGPSSTRLGLPVAVRSPASAAVEQPAPAVDPALAGRSPEPMLTGSILSAATWKQAAAALRLTK